MHVQPTRRSLLAAGAWAVPAISAVAASPAAAASAPARWSVTVSRAVLHPDEVAVVRATGIGEAGEPRGGEPVALTVDDPGSAVIDEPSGVTDGSGVYETTVRVRSDAGPVTVTVTLSGASGVATTTFDVRKTAAVVTHDVTGASTRVIALPHGSQNDVAAWENRAMAHSDWQITGRHVFSGQVLEVDVDADAPATLSLAIGTRGGWRDVNGGQGRDLQVAPLAPGRQSVTAAQDGLVFVRNSSTERVGGVTISGGAPHPVWVKDHTSSGEFAAQLSSWASAPAVSLIGERTAVDVQRRVVDDMQARGRAWDPADALMRMDRVVAVTCEVYGLTYAAAGIARKYPGRVYISGADSGGGGWAFATNEWLCFPVDTGATETLLSTPDDWVSGTRSGTPSRPGRICGAAFSR